MIDGKSVEVRECFAVPHNETMGEIFVDVEFHKNMFELHQQVSSKDVVVGWFSTRVGVGEEDALIHDFFASECTANPVMLSVDAALVTGRVTLQAFSSVPLTLGEPTSAKVIASQFYELTVDVRLGSKMMQDAEVVGLGVLSKRFSRHIPDEQDGLNASLTKLKEMIDIVTMYIDEVIAGKRKANVDVGKYLMDTLASVPLFRSNEEVEAMYAANVQDMYVMKYIVQLTRTQLFFAEKLRVSSM